MSRQSKAAKKKVTADTITKMHLAGDRGPKQTKPLHGKVNVEWRERANKRKAAIVAAAEAEKQKKAKEAKREREAAIKAKQAAAPAKKPSRTHQRPVTKPAESAAK